MMNSPLRRLCRLVRPIVLLGVSVLPAAALAAPAGDPTEQRVQPCLACHGEQGIDLQAGYVPRLHGKPAGYLYNQLVNYRAGRRRHQTMQYMVSHLSRDYLWEMAQYFAHREVPYPPAAAPGDDALLARGRELVRDGSPVQEIPACQACHGSRLTGVEPNVPGLLGLPRAYIASQLGAWRAGTRRAAAPDCMHRIAQRMAERDVQAVAAWLTAQPVPTDTRPRPTPIAEPPMECGSVSLPGHQ